MGSTAIMQDSTRYRGRTSAATATSHSLTQVPSGGDSDDEDHKTMSKKKQQQRRKRRRQKIDEEYPPFGVLVLQVGLTLLVICLVLFTVYRRVFGPSQDENIVYLVDDDDNVNNNYNDVEPSIDAEENSQGQLEIPSSPDYSEQDEVKMAVLMKQQKREMEQAEALRQQEIEKRAKTPPPLPHFELSEASEWDVYGIMQHVNISTTSSSKTFWQVAKGLRQRFAERYGNENIARMLLDQGFTTFNAPGGGQHHNSTTKQPQVPQNIITTACRFHKARNERRPFYFAFGGYSVTAGRGNWFSQSFPFQLKRILKTAVKMAGIVDLKVVNAAIGGCPAFPYGWCMKNFWNDDSTKHPIPDVVSWDFSMNEAGGVPEGLEAYVRHLWSTYSSKRTPKLIVRDTYLATPRREILDKYNDWLKDSVVLHTNPAVKPFLERQEEHNPLGFQEWRKFGAPVGSPGQALHHPALKEHELMGWMLAMHFLTALEYLESMSTSDSELLSCSDDHFVPTALPAPFTGTNTTKFDGILFGHETSKGEWNMNPIHCRTTFQPIFSGDLSELVVHGTIGEDLPATLPKSQMYYNEGWTLDLSEEEKQVKRKLDLYPDGLGFLDSKEAYYGIYESPAMQLLLPYETAQEDARAPNLPRVGQRANLWFESVVICQVNEKRDALDACNMGTDVSFAVGDVSNVTFSMMKELGTLYLGKPVCAKIKIPSNATLTSHNTLLLSPIEKQEGAISNATLKSLEQRRLTHDEVGLLLDIKVINSRVAHVRQACSISHVIWEQRTRSSIPSSTTARF